MITKRRIYIKAIHTNTFIKKGGLKMLSDQPVSNFAEKTITSMVENSTTQNLSIWAMVVILSIFLSAMVIIIKVFMNSSIKTNEGLKMVIQQSSEQLHIFRESVDRIAENFRTLSESIAKLQVLRILEEDRFDTLIYNFDSLKHEISDTHSSLFKIITDLDRSNREYYLSSEKNMEEFLSNLTEMRAFYEIASKKRKK